MADQETVNPDVEKLRGEIEALVKKNRELLDEKKATKTGAERLLADAQEKIEDLTGQIESTKRDYESKIKKLSGERDTAFTTAESERKANHNLLVNNGLTDALTKAGIRKELIPAARALLKEKGILDIESEGDVRRAIAKITVDGKEAKLGLEDYVLKHFALSDDGKAFIPADGNSGGGAGGPGRIAGAAKTMAFAAHQALGPKDQAAFFEEGGTLTV